MLEPMKSVSTAQRAFASMVGLCLLVFATRAAAQPASPEATAPAVATSDPADAAPPVSDGQQATAQAQSSESLEAERVANDTDPSALTRFHPVLAPYGVWLQHPTWGLIWVPHPSVVGPEFSPYVTSGHWTFGESGEWIWVSDFPFGWVVFHYGRWVAISGVGWAWIPGRRYAPAWVAWRVPDADYAYVGWGPLPPTWIWMNGVAVVVSHPPPTAYVFCPSYYVLHRRPYAFFVRDPVLVDHLGHHTHRYGPRHGRRGPPSLGPSWAEARIPRGALRRERVLRSADLGRGDARRATNGRVSRASRTAASPTPAPPSTSAARRTSRSVEMARTLRSRMPAGRNPSAHRARAPRTGQASRRGRSVLSPKQNGRTPGRLGDRSGPGRGFVPRVVPPSGARRRR